jgi:hypothetical protein
VLLIVVGVLVLVGLGLTGLSTAVQKHVVKVTCPPSCFVKREPAAPVAPPHLYKSSALGWSMEYFDDEPTQQDDHSIGWQTRSSSWLFTSAPAGDRTAEAYVKTLQHDSYPDAQFDYEISGAELGYHRGYGAVYDVQLEPQDGAGQRSRLIVMATVRNGVAIGVVAFGPYSRSTSADGHPNPANARVAGVIAEPGNTITWPGDPTLP